MAGVVALAIRACILLFVLLTPLALAALVGTVRLAWRTARWALLALADGIGYCVYQVRKRISPQTQTRVTEEKDDRP